MIGSRRISDPTFGNLKFRRSFGLFGAGFWEGEVFFHPTDKQVKVFIPAGKNGPSEWQRAFLPKLEAHYQELLDQVRDIVVDTPLNYFGPDFFGKLMPELRWEDFELDSIGLPRLEKSRFEWNLSYQYVPMVQTYSVSFEDWKPVYGELDD